MNIYDRLIQDHDTQKKLAKQLMETSGDSSERQQLFKQFKTEAVSHANAEEQTFYAALIKRPEGQEQTRHSISEHKEADDLITELTEADMSGSAWIQKFEKLKHDLEHHMKEEEEDVFDLAKSLLSDKEAEELSLQFDKRKQGEKAA
ncbi:hemerythrin domain-containing protein [Sneathiella sp.]|uniref:hemerythrin domain-containing protein n=1 Tax=Sneathiella sp. TaxID=1964365 RepID=UPI0035660D09